MNKKTIFAILVVVVAVGALLLMLLPQQAKPEPGIHPYFAIQEFGTAGDSAYLVFTAEGNGQVEIIGLNSNPQQRVFIVDEPGIGNSRLQEFADYLKRLEAYNFTVSTFNSSKQTQGGIIVVPTGAMPSWVLDRMKNDENMHAIYVGKPDLIIKTTTKKEDWYGPLQSSIKSRITVMDTTLDELLDSPDMETIYRSILENRWSVVSFRAINASREETARTLVVPINSSAYFHVISEINGVEGTYDFQVPDKKPEIKPEHDLYPWEDGWVDFVLPKTNGTAYLNIEKDGHVVNTVKLGRVTEETAYRESLRFGGPGEYVLKAIDNKGVVATGLVHVIEVKVTPVSVKDTILTFMVEIDGRPLQSGKVNVSIKNSTSGAKFEYPITDGIVTVQAKLVTGSRTFEFWLLGGKVESTVETQEESIIDTYVKYGPVGLVLIVIVFVIAGLGKQETYKIKIVDVAPEIRKEVRISLETAEELFRAARRDLRISGPLKPQEFAVGLKRYVTEGADVTEGNVEEILKKMGGKGLVLSWNGYYQLSTDGKIKRNVLMRMISEKLIEKGIHYKASGDKFITKELEIGFYGERFGKKAIIVFEDAAELKRTLAGLSEKERSKLFLKEFNGVLNLVPVEKLDEAL